MNNAAMKKANPGNILVKSKVGFLSFFLSISYQCELNSGVSAVAPIIEFRR